MRPPETIDTEQQLDEILTTPSPALVESVKAFSGTVVILGVGGKTGYTVAVRLRRAIEEARAGCRIVGVSRFSDDGAREALERKGVDTVVADLIDSAQVAALPDAERVVFLAGRKFGTTGSESDTWALNTLLPQLVCQRYGGTPVVAYSTGAVYDMVPVVSGGATEQTPLEPRGEYANAAVGRERVFEWASKRYGTPVCQIRLFYANDLRYGVLRDVADAVLSGKPIDLANGCVSLIWQGDAADISLRAFAAAAVPPVPINVTGPELVSIRYLAERFAEILQKEPHFVGEPADTALIANATLAAGMFGYPEVTLDTMIRWTAAWVAAGGRGLGKPTHWEVRDGRY